MKSHSKVYFFGLLTAWLFAGMATYLLLRQGRYGNFRGLGAMSIALLLWVFLSYLIFRFRVSIMASRISLAIALFGSLMSVYGVLCLALYIFQDRLVFVPVNGDFRHCERLLKEDEVVDTQFAGQKIRLYIRPVVNPRAWMILFHGNAESACRAIVYTEHLRGLGVNFVLAEYPGYLKDADDSASEQSLTENSRAVYDFVAARNLRKLPVLTFGRSLGTGIATYVASVREVSGVLLASPYTSIEEVGSYQYPIFPVRFLTRNIFPANRWAIRASGLVLAAHGTADRVIPFTIGQRQSENFPHLYKFLKLENFDHNDIVNLGTSQFWEESRTFVEKIENEANRARR